MSRLNIKVCYYERHHKIIEELIEIIIYESNFLQRHLIIHNPASQLKIPNDIQISAIGNILIGSFIELHPVYPNIFFVMASAESSKSESPHIVRTFFVDLSSHRLSAAIIFFNCCMLTLTSLRNPVIYFCSNFCSCCLSLQ